MVSVKVIAAKSPTNRAVRRTPNPMIEEAVAAYAGKNRVFQRLGR
jgi:hypothetical protein